MTKIFCRQHEHMATASLAVTAIFVLLSQVQVTDARDWYCGNAATTLMDFCRSCYATKRAHTSLPSSKITDGMFLTKERASGYLEAKRARLFSSAVNLDRRQHAKTNFVTECCYNSCSRFEMIKYCCTSRQTEFHNTEGKK